MAIAPPAGPATGRSQSGDRPLKGGRRQDVGTIGVALLDLSTGEFSAAEYAGADGTQALADELAVLKPREIVVPAGDAPGQPSAAILAACPALATSARPVTPIDGWMFDVESARRVLLDQLQAGTLDGFGLDVAPAAVAAAGALIHYLRGTQKVDLAHVRAITYRQRADCLLVDPTTLKHLEILEGAEGGREGSLLHELDCTVTSMGSRLLRGWLLRPLVALEPIRDRLDAVEELAYRSTERGKLREAIKLRCSTSSGWSLARRSERRGLATSSASSSRSASFRASAPSSPISRRRSCVPSSPSSTMSPTCATRLSARWWTNRRFSHATVASRGTASIRISTS